MIITIGASVMRQQLYTSLALNTLGSALFHPDIKCFRAVINQATINIQI